MSLSIKPIDPVSRPFFAGEVSGIDITRPLSREQANAVEAGMDQYGVLVFRDQHFTDETQLAFSRNFGELEVASGELGFGKKRRLASENVNDISNLDLENRVLAINDRKRLFALGNRMWHSDSSFKQVPAKFSLLSARVIPSAGGNTEFADMRAAYDTLDAGNRGPSAKSWCASTRSSTPVRILGFTDFTERGTAAIQTGSATFGAHASLDRTQIVVSRLARRLDHWLAGAGRARFPARPDRACDATKVRLRA